MKKADLQSHADHLGRLLAASGSIARALADGRATKSRKGSVRLIVADTDRASGGYAMLRVQLEGNASPNDEFGDLDGLHRAYYRAATSGTRDQYVLDAEALLSDAIRNRNNALFGRVA